MIIRVALVLLLFFTLKPAAAEHLPGGSLTYTCLGGNYFEVKLSLMRECSGSAMIPQSLNFSNSCGVVFDVADLQPVQIPYPSQICAADSLNTTCAGGTLPGFELYEFTTEIYLSPCNYWTIAWSICCRQPTINVQSTPGIYLETRLDNIADSCNTSPVFDHNGVPRVCIGQPVNYNAGATDPDGTRMEYMFIDARFASPSPVSVNYVFPNYGGEPVAGMSIDELGQISFTPSQQGYIIVTVQVDEYDENDVWIGSVMRDFPFLVTTCENTVPSAASGMITSSSGNIGITGDRSFEMCSGGTGCVSIEFTDPDVGGSLSIWTNADPILSGAAVEFGGTNPLTATICWQDLAVLTGSYSFVITVQDDACPTSGATSFVYTAVVADAPSAGTDNSIEVCARSPAFSLLDSLLGAPTSGGIWTLPDGSTHSGTFVGTMDVAGVYEYEVAVGGCIDSAQLAITFLPETDSTCILISVPEMELETVSIHPNPTNGKITIESRENFDPQLVILDPQGRMITSIQLDPTSRELMLPDRMTNGIYFLRGSLRSGRPFLIRTVLQR